MNYKNLKSMLESLIQSYKCPACNASVEESQVDIIGAAGTTINIDIACPKCKKHSMIKAEIAQVDINNVHQAKEKINEIKNILKWIKTDEATITPRINKEKKSIEDSQIVNLSKDLRIKKLEASDLFWEERED